MYGLFWEEESRRGRGRIENQLTAKQKNTIFTKMSSLLEREREKQKIRCELYGPGSFSPRLNDQQFLLTDFMG